MRANGKLDYAERICAALAYIGLAKLDRISIVPFGGVAVHDRLPPSRGKAQIFKVFQFLSALEAAGPTEIGRALEAFVHQTKRRGLAVVISDFYDPAGWEDGLNLLRYHRFEPTVLQVWSQAEARPSLRGDLEIVDVESGESREVTVTERQLAAFARAHADYCARLEAFCGARAIPYYRADVAVPFEDLVLRMFREGGFLS
jgi:Mg-chelatase subunit ChlD